VLHDDPLARLGAHAGPDGTTVRVWSRNASRMELVVVDAPRDRVVPMHRDEHDVWSATDRALTPGRRYFLRADGESVGGSAFDPERPLLDPWGRGLGRTGRGGWRSTVVDESFDWGGVAKPRTPLDETVVYEAHVRGLTRLAPFVPDDLRGSYAGLAADETIAYLKGLGVTAVQLLPVHAHVDEERLVAQGIENYWGYNTLSWFAPHAAYASRDAQLAGASAVLREFKGMVRLLHEAGLEVWLDVVYNHTSEEGEVGGPVTGLRGLDGASYYRHDREGRPVDVTGCGNSLDTSTPAAQRLVLDSLRFWADEVQVDGFRFDLAATLGRDADHAFDPAHPLLRAILDDPVLRDVKLVAEPWDVGLGGWQTGAFPAGFVEWNDSFRDRARDFWLTDARTARAQGTPPARLGGLASRLAGSADVFGPDRGPLAGVNLVTAHDGFTLQDLVSYDGKHNLSNGEDNRDGTDDNRSFNHGAEGPTDNPWILDARRRASRNLLATLFASAGVPMLTAGDERGRTQRGNNNAYCTDSELTWVDWTTAPWQQHLVETVQELTRLRREHPALRPRRSAVAGERVPGSVTVTWHGATGGELRDADWEDPAARTLQYVGASVPEATGDAADADPDVVLVVVHGSEGRTTVQLPARDGVTRWIPLWSSDDAAVLTSLAPGDGVLLSGPTVLLWEAVLAPRDRTREGGAAATAGPATADDGAPATATDGGGDR